MYFRGTNVSVENRHQGFTHVFESTLRVQKLLQSMCLKAFVGWVGSNDRFPFLEAKDVPLPTCN